MKNISLRAASVLQIISGGVHGISLFGPMQPQNDTEKQMLELVYGYHMDAGAGFHPTLGDFFLALSSCFTLMYLMAGITNFFLLRQSLTITTWKGLLIIQIIFFGIAFVMMFAFTFLPPVILTGLTFLLLIISYITTTEPANS